MEFSFSLSFLEQDQLFRSNFKSGYPGITFEAGFLWKLLIERKPIDILTDDQKDM